MRYTSAQVDAAARPVTITLGRASSRVGRWWLRAFRSWILRPVSAPQMMRLVAHQHDAWAYARDLFAVLRAALPRRWYYRFTGDPVTLIMGLPHDLRQLTLRSLFEARDASRCPDAELTDLEKIKRAQREQVEGPRNNGRAPSVAIIVATVRATYGEAWYYNPERWPTSDGYVPFAVAVVEYAGVQALRAAQRLAYADGFLVAHARSPSVRRDLERTALPSDNIC